MVYAQDDLFFRQRLRSLCIRKERAANLATIVRDIAFVPTDRIHRLDKSQLVPERSEFHVLRIIAALSLTGVRHDTRLRAGRRFCHCAVVKVMSERRDLFRITVAAERAGIRRHAGLRTSRFYCRLKFINAILNLSRTIFSAHFRMRTISVRCVRPFVAVLMLGGFSRYRRLGRRIVIFAGNERTRSQAKRQRHAETKQQFFKLKLLHNSPL